MRLQVLVTFIALVFSISVFAETSAKVLEDVQSYDNAVKMMQEEFAKIPENPSNLWWLSEKVKHMTAVDQYTRNFATKTPKEHDYSIEESEEFGELMGSRQQFVDSTNTDYLKKTLKVFDWFLISLFGTQVDSDAWLLVQHADHDVEFQKLVLTRLRRLYPKGETSPKNYAYLYDRIAASWQDESKRTFQRYGTQGECISKTLWLPIPIEDQKNVDARRKRMGLTTLEEYIKIASSVCKYY